MHAALVRSFDHPPAYEQIDLPAPTTPDQVPVRVLAAALHPRTRSGASGSHYTSAGALPLIPGVDGVGRDPDGALRYFVLHDTPWGSMAEQTLIDRRRSVVLPPDTDVPLVAAAMNPAMSSWIALRCRIEFTAGQRVLVLGATGNAGQLAVQIAKRLGAGSVVAAGRDPERLAVLPPLGADATVSLGGEEKAVEGRLASAAADVDVVLDYLWGPVTERAMAAILRHRSDRARPLRWVGIGSMAGLEITLPAAWLRASRVDLVGSGQGSVSTSEIVAQLPALAAEISGGSYLVDALRVPLREVEEAWNTPVGRGQRIVFVP